MRFTAGQCGRGAVGVWVLALLFGGPTGRRAPVPSRALVPLSPPAVDGPVLSALREAAAWQSRAAQQVSEELSALESWDAAGIREASDGDRWQIWRQLL